MAEAVNSTQANDSDMSANQASPSGQGSHLSAMLESITKSVTDLLHDKEISKVTIATLQDQVTALLQKMEAEKKTADATNTLLTAQLQETSRLLDDLTAKNTQLLKINSAVYECFASNREEMEKILAISSSVTVSQDAAIQAVDAISEIPAAAEPEPAADDQVVPQIPMNEEMPLVTSPPENFLAPSEEPSTKEPIQPTVSTPDLPFPTISVEEIKMELGGDDMQPETSEGTRRSKRVSFSADPPTVFAIPAKRKRAESVRMAYTCKMCLVEYDGPNELRNHACPLRLFECSTAGCGKTFGSASAKKKHEKTHSGKDA